MIRNPHLARSLCCVLEQNTLLLQVSLSTQVYKWFLFINDKWFEIVTWQDHYAVFLGKSLYSYKCISPHGCINDSRNCQGGLIKWWWTSIPSRGGGGVVHLILLVTSCWGNWNKVCWIGFLAQLQTLLLPPWKQLTCFHIWHHFHYLLVFHHCLYSPWMVLSGGSDS